MSTTMRLRRSLRSRLENLAARARKSLAEVAQELLEEALRMRECPGIYFADEPAGRVAKELTGFDVTAGEEVATIKHGVTRFRITLVCAEASLRGGRFAPGFYAEARWVTPAELADYPVSSPQRKLMTELANPQRRLF